MMDLVERDRINKLLERALDPSSQPTEREKARQAFWTGLKSYGSQDVYLMHRDSKGLDRSLLKLTRDFAEDRKKLLARLNAQSERIFFLEDQLAKKGGSYAVRSPSKTEPTGEISSYLKRVARHFPETNSAAARSVLVTDWRKVWEQTPEGAAQPKKRVKYGAPRSKGYIHAFGEMMGVPGSRWQSRISDAGTAGAAIPRNVLIGLIGTNLDGGEHLKGLKNMKLPDGRPDEEAQRRYITQHLVQTKPPKNKRDQLHRIRDVLARSNPDLVLPPDAVASVSGDVDGIDQQPSQANHDPQVESAMTN